MVTAYYSACVLYCFILTDSCPSASWAHAGKRCLPRSWCQQGESRAHAAIRWAEPKWMQERASPASQGHRFSVRKQETAGAGDSARQNMKAKNGHDTWWTQTLEEKLPPPPPLSPCARCPSPIAVLHTNEKSSKGKRSDAAWITVASSWTLTPCNVWSLIFPKIFRGGKLQRNLNRPIIESWHVGRGEKKLQAARNPQASFKREQGPDKKTAENNSEKWKVTWIER